MTEQSMIHSRLSRVTIILHWLVALGILGMLGFGLYVSELPRGPQKTEMIQIHKSFGVILFFILLSRLVWRLKEGWPSVISSFPVWEARLARSVQWFLLIAPFVMIGSGIAQSITYARPVNVFGFPFIPQLLTEKNDILNDIAGVIHITFAILIALAFALHAAGALRRHFVKRDKILMRMLGNSVASEPVNRR